MGTWSEHFVVGIRSIDEQHKRLIEKIDELSAAMWAGQGRSKLAPLLKFLEGYVFEHFFAEERIMRSHGYPKFEEHKRLHDQFKRELSALSQDLSATNNTSLLAIQVERQLSDWLVQHILGRDKEAAAFMTSKGAY